MRQNFFYSISRRRALASTWSGGVQTMADTITILGIAGSLRQSSFNAALLRAAAAAAPAGCIVDIAAIRGIPLYDGDVKDAAGIPAVVETLKERVAAADGLLLVTPEYNNSLPGVFKNAIDWLSRPRKISHAFSAAVPSPSWAQSRA